MCMIKTRMSYALMCCFYHFMQKLVANLIKLLSFIVLFNTILVAI